MIPAATTHHPRPRLFRLAAHVTLPPVSSSKASAPVIPVAADLPVTAVMLGKVRDEVLHRLDQSRKEASADSKMIDAKLDGMAARIDGMAAQVDRMEALMEAQNARNKVALDACMSMISRVNQIEAQVSQVDDTVRSLAASRPASG